VKTLDEFGYVDIGGEGGRGKVLFLLRVGNGAYNMKGKGSCKNNK
jgi:hypothetical protein